MRKVSLNKKSLLNSFLAVLLVQNAPLIASKLGLPASGVTGNAVAAGISYLAGTLLKKPDIATVGIAAAGANIANEMIVGPALSSFLPAPAPLSGFNSRPRLAEYVSSPTPSKNYAQFYN